MLAHIMLFWTRAPHRLAALIGALCACLLIFGTDHAAEAADLDPQCMKQDCNNDCGDSDSECEQCKNVAVDGAGCDDGDACTENDLCRGGTCAGTAISCDDSNGCTDVTCDPATGCVSTNNTASCEDGDACTENDTCAAGVCVSGAAVTCDDDNDCTDDSCDPPSGCRHVNTDAPCEDNNVCTLLSTCVAGECTPTDGFTIDCSPLKTECAAFTCDPNGKVPNCDTLTVLQPEAGNGPIECEDGNTCTDSSICVQGECVPVNGCGDLDGNGPNGMLDCIKILGDAVDETGHCPPDQCDLDGNCDVNLTDALGCLYCAVGLPGCDYFRNCPIPVGFMLEGDQAVQMQSTQVTAVAAAVDYTQAPGGFCRNGPHDTFGNPVNTGGDLKCHYFDRPGCGADELAGSVVIPFCGEPVVSEIARCYFRQDPFVTDGRDNLCSPGYVCQHTGNRCDPDNPKQWCGPDVACVVDEVEPMDGKKLKPKDLTQYGFVTLVTDTAPSNPGAEVKTVIMPR